MTKDGTAAEISRFYLAQKAFSGMVLIINRHGGCYCNGTLYFLIKYVKTQSI